MLAREARPRACKTAKRDASPKRIEEEELTIRWIPPTLLCPLSKALLQEPTSTPHGETYSKSAIEAHIRKHGTDPITNKRLTLAQLFPNRVAQRLLDQRSRFLANHGHLFDCLVCHEIVIDPIALQCCGRCICAECMQELGTCNGPYWQAKCPLCSRPLPAAQQANKELCGLIEFYLGSEQVSAERAKRKKMRLEYQEKRQQVKLYLSSHRLNDLIGLCKDAIHKHRSAVLSVVEMHDKFAKHWAENRADAKPLLLDETRLAFALCPHYDCDMIQDYILLESAVDPLPLLEQIQLNEGKVDLRERQEFTEFALVRAIRDLHDEGVRDELIARFLQHNNALPAAWDASGPYWLWNDSPKSKEALVLGFLDQLDGLPEIKTS